MESPKGKLERVDAVLEALILGWYDRSREHYVTDEDSKSLGVEPEVKCFQEFANHRIKFARKSELDVTYGLGIEERNGRLVIVASVNNKSEGFDFDSFVNRLESHYWRSRTEKPWTDPKVDHFAYGDLLHFEPRMGKSVSLDIRKEKADIIRLFFEVDNEHEEFLLSSSELLRDLVENYCLNPLKRIYAESYREN
ncbi:MAG: hypothetical protein JSU96_08445 [Acidobacteriota bacterium]|nr:MAG: hypothetical protein JSU96_08445 [Acidobacteriota bacterium]